MKKQYLLDEHGKVQCLKDGTPIEINKQTFNVKEIVWRRYNQKGALPNEMQQVIWKDNVWGMALLAFFFTFFFFGNALWIIDLPFFPRPPEWTDHISSSFTSQFFHVLGAILGHGAFEYSQYLEKVRTNFGVIAANALALKLLLPPLIASYSSYKAAKYVIDHPVDAVQILHQSGSKVYQPHEAEDILYKKLKAQSNKFGKHQWFATMSHKLKFDENSRRTHTLIFGTTGSGKSQLLAPHIKASIKKCRRTIILDPKREFADALYDPKDKSMAIIDFTDKHGSIPDIFNDINGPGLLSAVVAGMIPPEGAGDGSMWISAAQAISRGLIVYIQETCKNKDGVIDADWIDMCQLLLQSHEDLAYAIFEYYPEAKVLVGELNPDGSIKQNVTTAGIMINMFAKSEMWTGIAKYLMNNRNAKKISLEKFMTDPNYEIKTLFIYPNAEVETISKPFVSMILSYLISFIDNPKLMVSETEPIGTFFLDEFHAPGKMVNAQGLPVVNKLFERGRSKGWAAYVAVQDINQLLNLYKPEEVKAWMGTACNFMCPGANGETLKTICENLGKKEIQKYQVSQTHQTDATNKSENWQKYTEEALLPSDLKSMLQKVEGAGVRYYYISAGISDAFILEKPFESLSPRQDNKWTAVKPNNTISKDENSRVTKRLLEMKEQRERDRLLADELETEKAFSKDKSSSTGQVAGTTYYEDEPSDEEMDMIGDFSKNNSENAKIYKLIDFEEEACDELVTEVMEHKMLESMLDSHGITTLIGLAQAISTPYKNLTTSKQKFDNHQKEQFNKKMERVYEKDLAIKMEKQSSKS